MTRYFAILLLGALAACQTNESPPAEAPVKAAESSESDGQRSTEEALPAAPDADENASKIEEFMAVAMSAPLPADDLNFIPGAWRVENGAKICDGYMTRIEDEDYCAAEIPRDWIAREFDGETYYVQPLAAIDD